MSKLPVTSTERMKMSEGSPLDIALVIKNPASIKKIKNPSFDACMEVVMQDGCLLQFVPADKFRRYEYKLICHKAVEINSKALSFVQKDYLTSKDWKRLLEASVMSHTDNNIKV